MTPLERATHFAGLLNDKRPGAAAHWLAVAFALPITHIQLEPDKFEDGALRIQFAEGHQLLIWDAGRSCCESRYLTCDDTLEAFVGARLLHIECVDVDIPESDSDVHEQVMVKIETTKGGLVVVTHNEHNGYYGGFNLKMAWTGPTGEFGSST